MYARLGAGVEGHVGQILPQETGKAEIRHDQCVRALFIQTRRIAQGGVHLPIVHQCIHGHVQAHARTMTGCDRIAHGGIVKVPRLHAGVEQGAAQIYRVRAAAQGGMQCLGTAAGRQQFGKSFHFRFLLLCSCTPCDFAFFRVLNAPNAAVCRDFLQNPLHFAPDTGIMKKRHGICRSEKPLLFIISYFSEKRNRFL